VNPSGVHPAAEVFPLMSAEEIESLAADIKENGLRQPIILDEEGRVVDGRCRLRACKLAKVKPEFVTLNGDDPLSVVVSLNVHRRNLTQAQRAIAAREAWPLYEVGQGNRTSGKSSQRSWTRDRLSADFAVSDKAIQQARALGDDLAAEVKSGSRSLADAYAAHQTRADEEKRTEALPEDLAVRVREEVLALEEAEAVEEERRERVAAWVEKIREALSVLVGMAGAPVPAEINEALGDEERATLGAILGAIPERSKTQ